MPFQKKNRRSAAFSWKSAEVDCYYYQSASLDNLSHCKFYNSFVLNHTNYQVGDFVSISPATRRTICSLECLFEISGNNKAVVKFYEFAVNFEKEFHEINVEFDKENEVVLLTTKKAVIYLNEIIGKCRVICGREDETVSSSIDYCNLNREIYFLCRYKYIEDNKLIPILSGKIINEISIVDEEEVSFSNETPLQKVSDSIRRPRYRKTLLESMDIDNDFHPPRLDQVKKNLNKSFNESQDNNATMNYSIIEQPDKESLKIKLRVSNRKVLSNIPSTQPIVLLDTMGKFTIESEKNGIYEVKSPDFRNALNVETNKSVLNITKAIKISGKTPKISKKNSESAERVNLIFESDTEDERDITKGRGLSYNGQRTTERATKLSDLSNMVKNLKLKENSPLQVSPRKLRKLSVPLNFENSSDSDNENYPQRRRSARNRNKKISIQYDDQQYESNIRDNSHNIDDLKQRRKLFSNTSESESSNNGKSVRRKLKIAKNINSQTSSEIDPSKGNTVMSNVLKKESISRTPKSKRILKNTPLKLIREGVLTPAIDQRKQSVVKASTPLIMARNNLHVSYVPTVLPCRENEYDDVYNFIEGNLLDKCGGCMYISGVPGTGKTATVTVAIENLIKSWKNKGYPSFNYVSINGMRLTEPRQCYVEILKQLSGKRMPWEQALSVLEEKFTIKSSKKVVPTVLLVDELDILCTKRQDVVYNLLDWPTKVNAQLIVVTIANSMDLPERLLMSRVTSRLGLTRLTFQAYTHKQLQEIVLNRLTGNNSFKSDAVQFVARKVASVSGDARRALDICRRSAEIAEMEGSDTQVTMKHVNSALDAMITQPKVKAIAHCSRLEKLLLQSIIAEVERTGIEETVFGDVYTMLVSLAALEGFKMVSVSLVASAVYRLSSSRLLLVDHKCVDFNQRIILNISADDVYYALKND